MNFMPACLERKSRPRGARLSSCRRCRKATTPTILDSSIITSLKHRRWQVHRHAKNQMTYPNTTKMATTIPSHLDQFALFTNELGNSR